MHPAGKDVATAMNLMESTYHELKRRIIRLDLKPGESFSESGMAAALGLSKTPVREALARLEREGWVTVVARSGYFVAPVTLKQARDVLSVAVLLEAEAAALAARVGADVGTIIPLAKRAVRGRGRQDPAVWLAVIHELHVRVADQSGNQRLSALVDQVHDEIERLLHLSVTLMPSVSLGDPRELLEAIAGGDPDRAATVARELASLRQRVVLDALLQSDVVLSANLAPGSGAARGA